MELAPDQVEELRGVFTRPQVADEAGLTYILLEQIALPAGCSPPVVDALLCPQPRDGYTSRLFFSAKVTCGKPLNWNKEDRILERNWFAFSWKTNRENLRLLQMVLDHMAALR